MASTYSPTAADFSPDDLGPSRTSILAIVSLVLSLICIIPGAGLLGAIFGLAGLIGISQSRGRVGGTGLAVTGLILGLVCTGVWVMMAVGASQVLRMVQRAGIAPVTAMMTGLEAGDYTAARVPFGPELAGVTDDQLAKFREAYHAENGNFISIPPGLMDLIVAGQQAKPAFEAFAHAQYQNVIPMPSQFDKGWAITVVEMSPQQGKSKTLSIRNVGVFSVDGTKVIWLDDTNPPRAVRQAAPVKIKPGSQPAPEAPGSTGPATPGEPAGKTPEKPGGS